MKKTNAKNESRKTGNEGIKISAKHIFGIAIIIVVAVIAYVLLNPPKAVKEGTSVYVDYTGMFQNGTVFDTSYPDVAQENGMFNSQRVYAPLHVIVGAHSVISGFEDALYGMKEGEEKKVTIPPERAYGQWDKSKLVSVPKDKIQGENLTVGQYLYTAEGTGFRISSITDDSVVIDTNPRLAGQTLVFDLKITKIG